jgi:O-antigen ligase
LSSRKRTLFPLAVIVLVAWGVFAFGAEYTWAYAPLLVFSLAVSVLGLRSASMASPPSGSLALALGAVMIGATLQLLPLPQSVVAATTPAKAATDYGDLWANATGGGNERELQQYAGGSGSFSVAPSRTFLGLSFLAVLSVLVFSCAQGVGVAGAVGIARGVLVLGVAVALLELGQKASQSDVLYGFWHPPFPKNHHSAPFVNRNHTAGWLVMALSLSAGYFADAVARGLRRVKPGWRERVLWFSTPAASGIVLTGAAIAIMAIAILVTQSRSGFLALLAAIGMLGWLLLRHQPSQIHRIGIGAFLAFVVASAAIWGSVTDVLDRFGAAPTDVRLQIWRDTTRIIRDFPLTGTGLNTYGVAMLHYQTVDDGNQYVEAHNDYLHVAAEGGLLLGIPILITLALFIREIRRRFREAADDTTTYWLRAGAVVGLCAIAIQEVTDFTLQMPGAAVLFVVLAAIAIHRPAGAGHDATPGLGRVDQPERMPAA